jgi:hypothetical protein
MQSSSRISGLLRFRIQIGHIIVILLNYFYVCIIWQLRVDTLHPASLLPGAGILCRMHIYPYPTYSIYMNAPFIVSPPISEVSIEPENAPQGLAVSCHFIFTYTPCMPSEQID